MAKIIKSAFIILAVAALAGYGTYSFFSDTEKSTGNTFTAGSLDLKVDSQCSYNDAASTQCGNWELKDLVPASDKFFNFGDIKPGDFGENTISLHVYDNPAWACLTIENLQNKENGCSDPESQVDTSCGDPGPGDGDLAQELFFTAWADDGDNVWEANEPLLFSNDFGPASDVLDGRTYVLADSTTGTPIPGDQTQNIGVKWCFGTMMVDEGTHTISCDGANVGNKAQTDSLTADVKFYVEQSRNNPGFVCQQCSKKTIYTASVTGHDQGTLKNGNPITDPNRTDPTKANGNPDWVPGTGTNFYSLGKNTSGTEGWVILKFAGVVGNGPGNDLSVHEATNGRDSYPLENAKIEMSLDGTTWYNVGTASSEPGGDGVTFFDISSTPLATFQYVRLTDTTNYGPHDNTADGFDLDAVDAIYGACEQVK